MNFRETNLGYFNFAAANSYPDNIAVIDLSRKENTKITHSNLSKRMSSVALMRSNSGIKPGDRMLLGMGNRLEFIEIFFGAMRAGVVPIPLNIKLGAKTIDLLVNIHCEN